MILLIAMELIMKKENESEEKEKLQAKIADILSDKIRGLSTDFQEILIEDMVTAIENRLSVFTEQIPKENGIFHETLKTRNVRRHSRSANPEWTNKANAYHVQKQR
jgi:hypothetical protein